MAISLVLAAALLRVATAGGAWVSIRILDRILVPQGAQQAFANQTFLPSIFSVPAVHG
jgi:hypothetical protein